MNKNKNYTKPDVTVHPIERLNILNDSIRVYNQTGARDIHAKEKSIKWDIEDDESYGLDGDPWK